MLRWVPPVVTALLVAFHMVVAWRLRPPGITIGNDDALYVLLSRSIREFKYTDGHLLGAPPHVQYPPGYPALLALVSAAFGESPDHFMFLGVLCSGLALLLWYDIARRLWSPWLGLAVVAATAGNPSLVRYAGLVASEAPYLLVSTISLWLLSRPGGSSFHESLGGAAAILSAFIRSLGATLVVAVGLLWFLRRRFRSAAIFAAVVAVTLGAWFAWTAMSGPRVQGRSYVQDVLASLAERDTAAGRIHFYAGRVVSVLTRRVPSVLGVPTVEGTRVDNLVWLLAIIVFGGAGAWFAWRKQAILPLYAGMVLVLIVCWPYSLTRFLIPVVPLFALLLLAGMTGLGAYLRPSLARGPAALLTLSLAVTGWIRTAEFARQVAACERASAERSPGCYNEDQRSFIAAARFAADSTPAGAVFLTAKEAAFAYFANRAVLYPGALRESASEFLPTLQRLGVGYIVLGRNAGIETGFLASELEGVCDRLVLVAAFPPRTYLFKHASDSDPRPGPEACQAVRAYRDDPSPILPVR
jgi:4-amino-4-deoxy-L-arabinose transferase-like glycosyltransferase